MPIRNVNQNTNIPGTSVRINKITGAVEYINVPQAHYEGFEWVTTVTPNFFYKKENGLYLGNNSLRWAKSRHRAIHGSFEYKRTPSNPTTWLTRVGPYNPTDPGFELEDYLYPSTATSNSAIAQADSRVLQRLKNSKVNLAVSLGEGRTTANMITNTATRIAKAGLALRRGSIHSAANLLGVKRRYRSENRFRKDFVSNPSKAVSNGWLELQYGWLPLMSDIYGAAEHLAYRNEKRDRASARASESDQQNWSYTNAPASVYRSGNRNFRVTYVTTVHFSITLNVLSEMGQLGFTNPLEVAWELVPYSFVFDWFLPVGTYISNMDATVGKSMLGGTRSMILDQETYTTVKGMGGSTYYTGQGDGYKKRRRVYVDVLTGWPTNYIPRLQNPFSPTRALNALALLRQAFK